MDLSDFISEDELNKLKTSTLKVGQLISLQIEHGYQGWYCRQ